MTINRTTLLDLPLPVTGTESGTWGDTTNNGLTQYMDIAIAGMSNLTSANFTAGAVTIETTEGTSSATNIVATSAQYAGFRVTSLAQNSTITVGNTGTSPARSYRLINADATYSLTFKATGQTGVTLLPGQSAVVAFNGTDYVIVGMVGAGTATDNAVVRFDGTTGKLVQNSVVTIADSTGDISGVGQLNATTVDATNVEVTNIKAKDGTAAATIADSTGVVSITANPILSGGTANGVLYLNGSKVATSGSALTFDGTNLGVGGAATNYGAGYVNLEIKGTSTAGGVFTSKSPGGSDGRFYVNNDNAFIGTWSNTPLLFNINSAEQMRLTSTGLGIGTSSPTGKLDVAGSVGTFRIETSGARLEFTRDDANYIRYGSTNGLLIFEQGATERARIDSSGRLLIGTTTAYATTPLLQLSAQGGSADIFTYRYNNNTGGSTLFFSKSRSETGDKTVVQSGDSLGQIYFLGADGSSFIGAAVIASEVDGTPGANDMPGRLVFKTTADGASTPTERARITSGGNLLVGTTTDVATVRMQVWSSSSDNTAYFRNSNATPYGPSIKYTAASPNNTGSEFLFCEDNTALRASIRSNGGLANYSANNVNLASDERLKKDIAPLSSTWSKVKDIEVVNFRYKDCNEGDPALYGVIAQQVQPIVPDLVVVTREATETDPEYYGIREQPMYWLAIKALQEAMTRIETLEAKVAQLEGTQL